MDSSKSPSQPLNSHPEDPLLDVEEDDETFQIQEDKSLDFSIILLAAGNSSRMGQSKQLLEIEGAPLLLQATNTALAVGASNVVVVLGANEQPHKEIIKHLPVTIVSNHFWKTGMGGSIKAGLNSLIRKAPETEAVILMVCDQPGLKPIHLLNLVARFKETKSPIVASAYADTSGVPALFARSFFSNLLMLRDEDGAKKIIQQFAERVQRVEFPEGSHDLDTTEDYQNYLQGEIKKSSVSG